MLSRSLALLVGATLSLLTFVVGVLPAAAETPTTALEGMVGGVYVAPGAIMDVSSLQSVVQQAAADGITMLIAAPTDPQPTSSAYALRLRQLAEVDVVLVFGPDGEIEGSVSEDYFDGFARAEAQARLQPDPSAAATNFVHELTTEPPGGLPSIVGDLARYAIGFVAIIGLATVGEYFVRTRRQRRRGELASER